MQTHTIEILTATLKSDSTISDSERRKILKTIRGEPIPVLPDGTGNSHEPPRIYSREQAAKILGDKSERFVDLLCRRGLLKKFTPKGNQRAIGVTGASLHSFIGGS